MRGQKFLPEVRRNRFTSNWVRASRQGESRKHRLFRRFLMSKSKNLLVAVALMCLIGTGIAGHTIQNGAQQTTGESLASAEKAEAMSTSKLKSNSEACTASDLEMRAKRQVLDLGLPTDFEGYQAISRHQLGGIVVVEFQCEGSSGSELLRVRWELLQKKWLVKKISRSPNGRPGDL